LYSASISKTPEALEGVRPVAVAGICRHRL